MIELLGLTLSGEAIIALGVAFLVDEVLPFLPTKYNGIAHAIITGIKRTKIGKPSKLDEKLDRVLNLMEKWDYDASSLTGNKERGR